LLAAYTQHTRDVDRALVKRAATEVYGKRLAPSFERRLVAGIALAGLALLAVGTWRSLNIEGGWLQARFGPSPGFSLALPASNSGTANLAALLEDRSLPGGTDAAFETLFGIWGIRYARGGETACQQASQQGLRCWFQKGSLNHLKRLNRPAILGLIDEQGDHYQVVLTSLSEETVELTIASRQFTITLDDLSRYWYGDHLLLWQPGPWAEQILTPGMEDDGVRWLRETLASIQNSPSFDAESEFYDERLAARVRDYQRDRHLTVDGIVGTQTQIVMNTDLGIPGTPQLAEHR
jgi:general secretion pathway protein A